MDPPHRPHLSSSSLREALPPKSSAPDGAATIPMASMRLSTAHPSRKEDRDLSSMSMSMSTSDSASTS
ncbi:hypothetical protein AAFF_G00397950 [Aldrovandia affinis]|uniref:Uncharacterized protein n=1 Tax=Aldrovandia affinis TaxID=143900 RepID=A0AAD7SD52_9TELE|nr:hypothetical protein AAFF_G00397950 [Aldrovandia affinis]